jgi:cyclic pyranopterin phosphate synthase
LIYPNIALVHDIADYYNWPMNKHLTHVDESGQVTMVDVGEKPDTDRIAVASGAVIMKPETVQLIIEGNLKKGDVLNVAQIAGVMAAKRTSELIPLCHPLQLSHIEVVCRPNAVESKVDIEATVRLHGKTGVEMEALTAVAVAGLTIYDMAKAVDRSMYLDEIRVISKRGGQSGDFTFDEQ